jgi:hypothetical protein
LQTCDEIDKKIIFRKNLDNNGLVFEERRMIEVKHAVGEEWMVTIQGAVTTHHRVRVTKTDLDRLAEGKPTEALLQESFRFLLEREPNTSILGSFELPLIGRYFPEYETEIRARLRGS